MNKNSRGSYNWRNFKHHSRKKKKENKKKTNSKKSCSPLIKTQKVRKSNRQRPRYNTWIHKYQELSEETPSITTIIIVSATIKILTAAGNWMIIILRNKCSTFKVFSINKTAFNLASAVKTYNTMLTNSSSCITSQIIFGEGNSLHYLITHLI
jgi:hypothetical protein